MRAPSWHSAADAWFKLLGAIVLGYLILAQAAAIFKDFSGISIVLVGGTLLAYFLYPAVAWLNKRLPLWAALSIVYASGALVIAAIFYVLVPAAVLQIQGLMEDLPTIERSVLDFLHNPNNPFFSRLPGAAQHWVAQLPIEITNELQKNAAAYTSKVINTFALLVGVGAIAIAIPVVSIYMLAESPTIKRTFVRAFKPGCRRTVVDVLGDVDAVIGGFIRGQIVVAAVVGVLTIVALVILHVRFAFIIGVWAGVMDVIPYIGPFAGALPAVIIAYIFNGWGSAVGVVVAFVIINQLEGHLLGPRIVGSTVRITPLAVIFSLLICAKIFGFFGLIIAVPLAGTIRVLLLRIFGEDAVTNAQLRPGLTHVPRAEADPHATGE